MHPSSHPSTMNKKAQWPLCLNTQYSTLIIDFKPDICVTSSVMGEAGGQKYHLPKWPHPVLWVYDNDLRLLLCSTYQKNQLVLKIFHSICLQDPVVIWNENRENRFQWMTVYCVSLLTEVNHIVAIRMLCAIPSPYACLSYSLSIIHVY